MRLKPTLTLTPDFSNAAQTMGSSAIASSSNPISQGAINQLHQPNSFEDELKTLVQGVIFQYAQGALKDQEIEKIIDDPKVFRDSLMLDIDLRENLTLSLKKAYGVELDLSDLKDQFSISDLAKLIKAPKSHKESLESKLGQLTLKNIIGLTEANANHEQVLSFTGTDGKTIEIKITGKLNYNPTEKELENAKFQDLSNPEQPEILGKDLNPNSLRKISTAVIVLRA